MAQPRPLALLFRTNWAERTGARTGGSLILSALNAPAASEKPPREQPQSKHERGAEQKAEERRCLGRSGKAAAEAVDQIEDRVGMHQDLASLRQQCGREEGTREQAERHDDKGVDHRIAIPLVRP